MVTYEQLWRCDPHAWRVAGAAWSSLVPATTYRVTELAHTAAGLRTAWRGDASTAADAHLAGLRAPLESSRVAFLETDQVLAELAAELARARGMLAAAVEAAAARSVEVDRSGRAWPVKTAQGAQARRAADETTTLINNALDAAERADRAAAARLGALAGRAAARWPSAPPPAAMKLPTTQTDPASVRRWWDGLTAEQRRWLVCHRPDDIGRLDGVPVAERDQANRLLIASQRADLMQRRRDVLHSGRQPAWITAELHRLGGLMSGLDAVAARLASADGDRAYLLGLDPAGDGRAVVAIGDPDRADNVAVHVPGMTSDLAGVRGELGRAERVAVRAAELDPTQRTAGILWLDYDAPDFIDDAATRKPARAAAPGLHRFAEGLRATHEGPAAHQTVVGHSYGTLVVATTARSNGLAADSVVFLGSPGVGVDSAADLHVPGTAVWSSTAPNDIVAYLTSPQGIVDQLLPGPSRLPQFLLELFRRDDDLWFGRNPTTPEFGARVFASEAHGHLGYWDYDNVALDGLANITLGPECEGAVIRR
jgi:hypothetical protein